VLGPALPEWTRSSSRTEAMVITNANAVSASSF